jgi:hypothetical protein
MKRFIACSLLVCSLGAFALIPSVVLAASRQKIVTTSPEFVGVPKTMDQLFRCPVVGNKSSNIYHLRGSKYIKTMSVTKKICYKTEKGAINAGFRKAK